MGEFQKGHPMVQTVAIRNTEADECNRALVRRAFDEVWNRHNLAAIDEVFAADVVYHGGGNPICGTVELRRRIASFQEAFPDICHEIEDLMVAGDRVVVRWTGRGTHEGEFMGIPASGLRMQYEGITICQVRGGRIGEVWVVADILGLLQCLWG